VAVEALGHLAAAWAYLDKALTVRAQQQAQHQQTHQQVDLAAPVVFNIRQAEMVHQDTPEVHMVEAPVERMLYKAAAADLVGGM
jgi:hypothetical protein